MSMTDIFREPGLDGPGYKFFATTTAFLPLALLAILGRVWADARTFGVGLQDWFIIGAGVSSLSTDKQPAA